MSPLESRLFALAQHGLRACLLSRETRRWYLDLYGEPNRQGWQETERLLGLMHAQARHVRLVLALWPLLLGPLGDDYPFAPAAGAIETACERAGIACLDLHPALRGTTPQTRLWVTPRDDHPNALAHRLARALAWPVDRLFARP